MKNSEIATLVVATIAIVVSAWAAWQQHRLAVGHAGAQAAMAWRDQVIALHDRGLEPAEIRWIMYAEDGGTGYESGNGIIDEVLRNVPRLPPQGLEALRKDPRRTIPRPHGRMRLGDGGDALSPE